MRALGTIIAAILLWVQATGAQTPGAARGQGPLPGGDPGEQFDRRTVLAGELLIEPPTLINLGFEWFIDGDENRNAAVAARHRR
jgi:hypothetical protein